MKVSPGSWVSHQDISELIEFFGSLTLYERYRELLSSCQWVDPLPRQSGQHRKWFPLEELLRWVDITESQVAQLIEMKVMLYQKDAVRLISMPKVLVRCRAGAVAKDTPREKKWKTDYSSPLFVAPICELAEATIMGLDVPKWAIPYLCPYWGSLQCIECEHPPIRECSWECWQCSDKCSCFRCDRLCDCCSDKEKCQTF